MLVLGVPFLSVVDQALLPLKFPSSSFPRPLTLTYLGRTLNSCAIERSIQTWNSYEYIGNHEKQRRVNPWTYFGVTLDLSWTHPELTLALPLSHFGLTLDSFWTHHGFSYLGLTLDSQFWTFPGLTLESYRTHIGFILCLHHSHWTYLVPTLESFQSHLGLTLDSHWMQIGLTLDLTLDLHSTHLGLALNSH